MTESVALSISQIRDAWRIFCAACPDTASGTAEGIEFLFSGLPVAFFNVALLTTDETTTTRLDAAAAAAREWASPRGVPWLFLVTHQTLAPGVDADAVLHARGLVPVLVLTGMVAEHVPRASVPAGLRVDVPHDEIGYGSILDINGAAYGENLDACKPSFARPAFWAGHVPVVGVADGQPVTCAAVLMAGGYRYVAMVATDPSAQRRGYAAAAMLHALEVAARTHGWRPSFLHATAAGKPIYERMGYAEVATHAAYIVADGDVEAHS